MRLSFGRENARLCVVLMTCACFALANLLQIAPFSYLAFFLLGILVLTGAPQDDLVLYISLIPFAGMAELSGYNLLFLFLLWSVGKLIVSGYHNRYPTAYWVTAILFFGLVIMQDLFHASIGRLCYLLSIQLYFTAFILFADVKRVKGNLVRKGLFFSLLLALFLSLWTTLKDNTGMIERLGEASRQLGGAMGLPIYCLLLLSMLLEDDLEHERSAVYRLVSILFMALIGLLGLLTLSRVFLLGLGVLALCFFWMIRKGKAKRVLTICLAGAALIALFWLIFPGEANRLVDSFYLRLKDPLGSGRLEIYKDCLLYLLENPLRLLLGNGAFHYVQIGQTEGYAFSAMAHNLYLDLVMSWGLFGVLFFVTYLRLMIKRLKKAFPERPKPSSMMAILTLAACFMTEGTMQYYNIYFYILFLLINRYGKEGGVPDETGRYSNLSSGG